MRTYFRSLSDVLGSPLAQTAQTFSPRHAGGHRVLKSTKLEDAAYRDLRRGDNELDALEKACGEKENGQKDASVDDQDHEQVQKAQGRGRAGADCKAAGAVCKGARKI